MAYHIFFSSLGANLNGSSKIFEKDIVRKEKLWENTLQAMSSKAKKWEKHMNFKHGGDQFMVLRTTKFMALNNKEHEDLSFNNQ